MKYFENINLKTLVKYLGIVAFQAVWFLLIWISGEWLDLGYLNTAGQILGIALIAVVTNIGLGIGIEAFKNYRKDHASSQKEEP